MDNATDIATLAGLILATVQLIRYFVKDVSGEILTLAVTVVLGGIAYFISDALGFIEVLVALAFEVLAYDMVVRPVKNSLGL